MKDSLKQKLVKLALRFQEIGQQLSDSKVVSNQNLFRDLGKEYSHLDPIVKCFEQYQKNADNIESAKQMLKEDDKEMQAIAYEEIEHLNLEQEKLAEELKVLLLPKDPNDAKNVFLEIRGGAGGSEAAIFAGDLFRMYT